MDKTIDRSELRKTWGGIFDDTTIFAIYRLMTRKKIKKLVSSIKEGKESLVLAADDKIAIKVYATKSSNFKRMQQYLIGDPRFAKIKSNKRSIIFAWCQKEYNNLLKARAHKVSCPKPIAFQSNVLVMEFLGKNYEAYPRLKDADIKNPKKAFDQVYENLRKLYNAGLVHADLSEYNILLGDKIYFIDFSQSVILAHPDADKFLERDIHNVCKFFSKYLTVDPVKILEKIKNDLSI
ncbi:MAG: serine protein kinase RIO [Nanoarchaeota archaeon]|nr:serine protein kinase RIO [Nanoarchaeota archaeon]MBU4124340.1 serine protein kinase RIO [Nanoarchaeota archaeon]